INVCNYLNLPFCASIYIYYLFNENECKIHLANKFLGYYNYNIEEFLLLDYEKEREKYGEKELFRSFFGYYIEIESRNYKEILDYFYDFIADTLYDYSDYDITNEIISIFKFYVRLKDFREIYKD